MEKSKLKAAMREMREGETQQQIAMELNVSRELISKIENGSRNIPADISRKMMDRKENPWFALAIRNEYTGTGSIRLNGPNVDLHRSSVKEKTIEEIEEMLVALKSISFAKPLRTLSNWEKPGLEKLIEEAIEATTAIEHLIAIVCEEAGISYLESYQQHYLQLQAKGYLEA
ncbi:helix-turn-helix domain-containing protein [Planococcus koreensis]|uniref:helix-turn-helix domain-containing protein n=1 Tax=Planococcus koreensis TaxID=112331 RepID=UPI0039FD65C1